MRYALIALFALAACAPDFEPDEVVCGVAVRWNGTERDPEGVCETVRTCDAMVGVAADGALVDFLASVEGVCTAEGSGGCYRDGVITVRRVPDMRVSGLCHELAHRHLDDLEGDPDPGHHAGVWSRVDDFERVMFQLVWQGD